MSAGRDTIFSDVWIPGYNGYHVYHFFWDIILFWVHERRTKSSKMNQYLLNIQVSNTRIWILGFGCFDIDTISIIQYLETWKVQII
jgi:hypothetical protein